MTYPDDLTGSQFPTNDPTMPRPASYPQSDNPATIANSDAWQQPTPPSGPAYPSRPYSPQTAYLAPSPAPAPVKKKSKAWLVVLIIALVVLGAIAALCFTVLRPVIFGHRSTPYCQTYIRLSHEMPEANQRLADAQADGDLPAVEAALNEIIGQFQELRDANPPENIAPSIDTVITYFTDLKEFVAADDPEGYNDYLSSQSKESFTQATTAIDDDTVIYCN